MRLKSIQLSGFKSFADLTALELVGNRACLVGPNGSGKSNLVDALRWVCGESSAARLRSDNLSDVVFAGTASRRRAGRASVELVLDNSDGEPGPDWARFSEVVVRRIQVSGEPSEFFINNKPVRRRDLIDLLRGTGLIVGGYGIVEQGMISDIAEASPSQLGRMVEEAAGISRYRERRAEAEARLGRTEENLARAGLARAESERNYSRLRKEARAAELHEGLARQRDLIRLQLLNGDCARAARDGDRLEAEWRRASRRAAALAGKRDADQKSLKAARDTERRARAEAERRRREFYRAEAELELLRQQLRARCDSGAELEKRRRQLQLQLDRAATELQGHRERLLSLEAEIASAGEHQGALERTAAAAAARLRRCEDECSAVRAQRGRALSEDQAAERHRLEAENFDARLDGRRRRDREEKQLLGRLVATLQGGEAKGADPCEPGAALDRWMRDSSFANRGVLADGLTVEEGWERAVAAVLGPWLQAPVVETGAGGAPPAVMPAGAVLLAAGSGQVPSKASRKKADGTLACRCSGASVPQFLNLVRTVEDAAAAWELLPSLGAGLSVVSRDGLWLGPGWARSAAAGGSAGPAPGSEAAAERVLEQVRARLRQLERRMAADDRERRRLERQRQKAGSGPGQGAVEQTEKQWQRLLEREQQAREAASRAAGELRACQAAPVRPRPGSRTGGPGAAERRKVAGPPRA